MGSTPHDVLRLVASHRLARPRCVQAHGPEAFVGVLLPQPIRLLGERFSVQDDCRCFRSQPLSATTKARRRDDLGQRLLCCLPAMFGAANAFRGLVNYRRRQAFSLQRRSPRLRGGLRLRQYRQLHQLSPALCEIEMLQ